MTAQNIASAFIIMLASIASATAPTTQGTFHFGPNGEQALKLFDGDRLVFVYKYSQVASGNARNARPRSGYLHPIYGLDGKTLTDDFPADHVNHLFDAYRSGSRKELK